MIAGLACDGYGGSSSPFALTTHAPTVTGNNAALAAGHSVAVSTLFTASNPDGLAITQYQFYDPTPSVDSINLNGATNLLSPAQAAAGYSRISAADLSKVQLVGV